MPKIIGLTGGIGSGKTTIASYFSQNGIPVYIADEAARKVSELSKIQDQIQEKFGSSIIENGILNRKKLAKIVFNNPEKLTLLNAIIHPEVQKHFQNWMEQHQNNLYVIYEAAILFETGNYKNCYKIITVTAPIETRISRIIQRDSTTRNEVLQRINAQLTDEDRIPKSDYIIDNTTTESSKQDFNKILKILDILQ